MRRFQSLTLAIPSHSSRIFTPLPKDSFTLPLDHSYSKGRALANMHRPRIEIYELPNQHKVVHGGAKNQYEYQSTTCAVQVCKHPRAGAPRVNAAGLGVENFDPKPVDLRIGPLTSLVINMPGQHLCVNHRSLAQHPNACDRPLPRLQCWTWASKASSAACDCASTAVDVCKGSSQKRLALALLSRQCNLQSLGSVFCSGERASQCHYSWANRGCMVEGHFPATPECQNKPKRKVLRRVQNTPKPHHDVMAVATCGNVWQHVATSAQQDSVSAQTGSPPAKPSHPRRARNLSVQTF